MSELRIRCRNTGKRISLPFGSNLYEAFKKADFHMDYGPVAARVNNKVQGMNYRFYNNKDVEFLSLSSQSGMRTYTRTLFLILAKAVEDTYPETQLLISGSVSRGYYCELRMERPIEDEDVLRIKQVAPVLHNLREVGIDMIVVLDVVLVVGRRDENRIEPDALNPEGGDVVELGTNTLEVTDTVSVRVLVRRRVNLVNDGVVEPPGALFPRLPE